MKSIPGTIATALPSSAGVNGASKNPFLNGLNDKKQPISTDASQVDTQGSYNPFASGVGEKGQPLTSNSIDANGAGSSSAAGGAALPDGMTNMDFPRDTKSPADTANPTNPPQYAPPSSPPPASAPVNGSGNGNAAFAPPPHPPPSKQVAAALRRPHTNAVIEAAQIRARDEQQMQNLLQSVQLAFGIYNTDIEPEHETDYYCGCGICNYQRKKWNRLGVQDKWSRAVIYPGEKSYNDDFRMTMFVSGNPYYNGVISPYGRNNGTSRWFQQGPQPRFHAMNVRQTIQLNAKLNGEAQRNVDAKEPKGSIWQLDEKEDTSMVKEGGDMKKAPAEKPEKQRPVEKQSTDQYPAEKGKRQSVFGGSKSSNGVDSAAAAPAPATAATTSKASKGFKLTSLIKAMGVSSSDDKTVAKSGKAQRQINDLRDAILAEEGGRWPDEAWRDIIKVYMEKIGMAHKVADLRARQPLQYLHLLRAGYFEPIPVEWANLASNPLKFSIEASSGWRGITPTWRGFEDTAEERLYWVLNHREGSVGMRMKPDFISEMNMARERMESAVEPPPQYFTPDDTCHIQHTSEGYSRQVMPTAFKAYDRPESPNDDTMILLDVSGSMDFDPVRPVYDQYMITSYARGTQPKNKDVARAIIRRFTDAMANHDHTFNGYDLITFSSKAAYIGSITHKNLDAMWNKVRIGGGTRVMTGWQKVKDLHFQKHSESATHHPVYGWQAGPQTPILRLLLLLDGEATDMDEFELDLLGLSWAHVTIFLIGVDGCPHHHRHANELQRISNVNHHVSFVDAQGNTPERFVTHELLKRHLGYDVTMAEFERMEELPAYS
ncbi:hypothetical protein CBS101457_005563 [Exobasidium rhododendri]|nr:hypothetical protein CBS101457_005563 [Exobasidium rhododendri]